MCPIPESDRIVDRTPHIDPTNKASLSAPNLMLIFDRIVDGYYTGFKLPIWTTAGRPAQPVSPGTCGFNSDISQLELYDGNEWVAI